MTRDGRRDRERLTAEATRQLRVLDRAERMIEMLQGWRGPADLAQRWELLRDAVEPLQEEAWANKEPGWSTFRDAASALLAPPPSPIAYDVRLGEVVAAVGALCSAARGHWTAVLAGFAPEGAGVHGRDTMTDPMNPDNPGNPNSPVRRRPGERAKSPQPFPAVTLKRLAEHRDLLVASGVFGEPDGVFAKVARATINLLIAELGPDADPTRREEAHGFVQRLRDEANAAAQSRIDEAHRAVVGARGDVQVARENERRAKEVAEATLGETASLRLALDDERAKRRAVEHDGTDDQRRYEALRQKNREFVLRFQADAPGRRNSLYTLAKIAEAAPHIYSTAADKLVAEFIVACRTAGEAEGKTSPQASATKRLQWLGFGETAQMNMLRLYAELSASVTG